MQNEEKKNSASYAVPAIPRVLALSLRASAVELYRPAGQALPFTHKYRWTNEARRSTLAVHDDAA